MANIFEREYLNVKYRNLSWNPETGGTSPFYNTFSANLFGGVTQTEEKRSENEVELVKLSVNVSDKKSSCETEEK